MSNNEIGKLQGTIYSQVATGPLAVTGTLTSVFGGVNTRLTPQSRILGVTSSNTGAPVGTVYSVSVVNGTQADVALGKASVIIQSSVAADTSLITLYWYNESASGLILA